MHVQFLGHLASSIFTLNMYSQQLQFMNHGKQFCVSPGDLQVVQFPRESRGGRFHVLCYVRGGKTYFVSLIYIIYLKLQQILQGVGPAPQSVHDPGQAALVVGLARQAGAAHGVTGRVGVGPRPGAV